VAAEAETRAELDAERFALAVEGANDGLWEWDLVNATAYYSPRLKAQLGYADDELPNEFSAWDDLIHPDDVALADATYRAFRDGAVPTFELEHRLRQRDGTYRWILARGAARRDEQGRAVRVAGWQTDIHERKLAREALEQRVAERTQEVASLLEVSRIVAGTLDLQPLLEVIFDQLKYVADYGGGAIMLLDGDELVIVASRTALNPETERAEIGVRYKVKPGSALWAALERGDHVIVADVRGAEPVAAEYRRAVGDDLERFQRHVTSWLAVPLLVKERVIGALGISHPLPNFYTERHARLASAIGHQAAIAIENARLHEHVRGLAAVEERQRLARELHDSVSQALYGIALGARTARTMLDRDPMQAAEPLDYVLQLADVGLAEMRALIFELRPAALETDGLVAALERRLAATRARHGVELVVELCEVPIATLDNIVALYLIAQEALYNTIKHARATRVELRLSHANEWLTLDLRDNGAGFDPTGAFPSHLGLRSMRERAHQLGGTLEIESAPGAGAWVVARLPTNA
jgi:PAS domain S-box-containing protein